MKNPPELLGAATVQLSICYQHFAARLNAAMKPIDLNMTQISILTHLSRCPDASETVSSLATNMEMNQPAVTKAVKAMSNHGWIEKQVDEDDARIAYLKITKAGHAQIKKAHQTSFPLIEKTFSQLSPKEIAQLLNLLGKMKTGMDL